MEGKFLLRLNARSAKAPYILSPLLFSVAVRSHFFPPGVTIVLFINFALNFLKKIELTSLLFYNFIQVIL